MTRTAAVRQPAGYNPFAGGESRTASRVTFTECQNVGGGVPTVFPRPRERTPSHAATQVVSRSRTPPSARRSACARSPPAMVALISAPASPLARPGLQVPSLVGVGGCSKIPSVRITPGGA